MPKRSNEANRYYWALINAICSRIQPRGEAFSVESWHHYFKGHFLGCSEIKMPNGKTVVNPHSTADLDTDEFAAYVEQVSAWAAEHGVWLEDERIAA